MFNLSKYTDITNDTLWPLYQEENIPGPCDSVLRSPSATFWALVSWCLICQRKSVYGRSMATRSLAHFRDVRLESQRHVNMPIALFDLYVSHGPRQINMKCFMTFDPRLHHICSDSQKVHQNENYWIWPIFGVTNEECSQSVHPLNRYLKEDSFNWNEFDGVYGVGYNAFSIDFYWIFALFGKKFNEWLENIRGCEILVWTFRGKLPSMDSPNRSSIRAYEWDEIQMGRKESCSLVQSEVVLFVDKTAKRPKKWTEVMSGY